MDSLLAGHDTLRTHLVESLLAGHDALCTYLVESMLSRKAAQQIVMSHVSLVVDNILCFQEKSRRNPSHGNAGGESAESIVAWLGTSPPASTVLNSLL